MTIGRRSEQTIHAWWFSISSPSMSAAMHAVGVAPGAPRCVGTGNPSVDSVGEPQASTATNAVGRASRVANRCTPPSYEVIDQESLVTDAAKRIDRIMSFNRGFESAPCTVRLGA
jgi:hypothetical protein